MSLDIRETQTVLEDALRDAILYALGVRLAPVSTITALRAVSTQGASSTQRSDDDLIAVTGGASVISYRWNTASTAADDGVNVIQPTDVTANGRWLKWTSPLRFSPSVGADSVTLDQLTTGILRRVVVLDKDLTDEEFDAVVAGTNLPAVVIEAKSDDPDDAVMATGATWFTSYEFTVFVISENLRNRRQAAQGSTIAGDPVYGANAIDGFIKVILAGIHLYSVVDAIRQVRLGRGYNWRSDLLQRRVIRERSYTIEVTECFPNAPNEIGLGDFEVSGQTIADLGQQTTPDPANYITSDLRVIPGMGLTQMVRAGSAVIAGVTVNFGGQLTTFDASSDVYRDLLPSGSMVFIAVQNDAPPPAVTAGALRIGVTTTDASNVLADVLIAASKVAFLPTPDA